MLRWLYALVIGGILSAYTFLLLTGRYLNDGPVVMALSESHGLHAGDLFVIAGWVVGMGTLVRLTTAGRARAS